MCDAQQRGGAGREAAPLSRGPQGPVGSPGSAGGRVADPFHFFLDPDPTVMY